MFGPGFETRLTAARGGDEAAWHALYLDLTPILSGYLRGQRCLSPEDVVSETMFQVVRDLHRFDGTEAQFRSWVFAIAHHRMIDARRHAAARPVEPSAAEVLDQHARSVSFEDHAVARLGAAELDHLLACTTDDQRTVLLLRYVSDLSLHEVAAALGKEYNAVKALHRRALGALRAHVASGAYPSGPGSTLSSSG